ncbi:hatching enzyme 1.2-like isoform X1 [Physella acuta]|uniref:hatching enzyme 1.2-like isoform X1 n=1 Tax=Physella acuta TaxID=109671 RepID=UPI0027DCA7BB|nr:hatching enzyme 1.2-like isoform X1 [Physella acuta]
MVTMATCLGALIVLVLMTSVSSIPIATGEDGTLNPPIVVQYLTPPEGQREQLTSDDVLEKVHRNAVSNKTRRWANGIVPYTISREFPTAIQLTIREAMDEIEADAANGSTKCVQFVPRSTEPRYLQINTGSGCHSTIGYDETEELSSTLGAGCEQKGIIMHELLHVLGFYHEQNRPDRDLYVNINETNVALIRDFYIRNSSVIDTLEAPYDFGSIMHYPAFAFPIDPTYPTITPKPSFAAGLKMGQRIALSKIDVIKLQRLYGCVQDDTHVFSDLQQHVLTFCDFGQDMCNFSYVRTTAGPAQTADGSDPSSLARWTVTSASISGGPKGGMTNGVDSFLYASRTTAANDSTPLATPSVLTTTSVLTPVIRSPDDGKLCITFQMYQRGPASFISMYLVFETLPRTLLMIRGGDANRWSRAVLTTELPPGLNFQLEIVANLAQEPLAIDDFYVLKSKCLYA